MLESNFKLSQMQAEESEEEEKQIEKAHSIFLSQNEGDTTKENEIVQQSSRPTEEVKK